VENLVIHGAYRGWELVGTYLAAGGVVTLETMQILGQFDLAGRAGTPEWAGLVAQALLLAREDFMDARAEPDDADAARLLSEDWTLGRAAEVEDPSAAPVAVAQSPRDELAFAEALHTTHVSVADGSGMLVALTQSVGPTMGSKVAAPGLGFIYAATMGYLVTGIRPFARAVTYQSPIIVLRDGQPRFVLGAAGGHRIVSAVTEVLSRLRDEGLDLPHAMAAARLNPLSDTLYMEAGDETGWTDEESAFLRSLGFPAGPRASSYFARVNGIAIDPETGMFTGVADPRWAGAAEGVGRRE
jgi:gamma-glutamyltranspeptidase/glutathione hydrolase